MFYKQVTRTILYKYSANISIKHKNLYIFVIFCGRKAKNITKNAKMTHESFQ